MIFQIEHFHPIFKFFLFTLLLSRKNLKSKVLLGQIYASAKCLLSLLSFFASPVFLLPSSLPANLLLFYCPFCPHPVPFYHSDLSLLPSPSPSLPLSPSQFIPPPPFSHSPHLFLCSLRLAHLLKLLPQRLTLIPFYPYFLFI